MKFDIKVWIPLSGRGQILNCEWNITFTIQDLTPICLFLNAHDVHAGVNSVNRSRDGVVS
jgi:hypothetical protein